MLRTLNIQSRKYYGVMTEILIRGTITRLKTCPQTQGDTMNIHKSRRTCASLLTTAGALFWLGTAGAAPLSTLHPSNPAPLLGAVMHPADEADSNEALPPRLQRQVVNYATTVAVGTIVIDTAQTYLYFVLGQGKAIRYGIGVGREG